MKITHIKIQDNQTGELDIQRGPEDEAILVDLNGNICLFTSDDGGKNGFHEHEVDYPRYRFTVNFVELGE